MIIFFLNVLARFESVLLFLQSLWPGLKPLHKNHCSPNIYANWAAVAWVGFLLSGRLVVQTLAPLVSASKTPNPEMTRWLHWSVSVWIVLTKSALWMCALYYFYYSFVSKKQVECSIKIEKRWKSIYNTGIFFHLKLWTHLKEIYTTYSSDFSELLCPFSSAL